MHEVLSPDQVYVTVDTLILTVADGQLCLLLSRRKDPPYEGRPALPGRFIGREEAAESAVRYLMDEMLPDTEVFQEQLYTFTAVARDPRGRVISMAYLVIVPWERLQRLITEKELPFRVCRVFMDDRGLRLVEDQGAVLLPEDLAFDHGRIIETGVSRLRGKIDYTDIGFRFLETPGAFSLSELQTVFEAVLGETLDSSNFRRAILGRYEKTGRLLQTDLAGKRGRGRPAALYRFTE